MNTTPRAIRPDDLEIFAQIPGIIGVARDNDLRVIWCTPSYGHMAGNNASANDMIGTTIGDVLPPRAAQERTKIQQRVMETNQPQSHYRLIDDSRVLCTILPLDERAFGHQGVFIIVQDAQVDSPICAQQEFPVVSTPLLNQLESLTKRELEVLHFVAAGMSTHQISKHLSRADKTIEHHINAIHSKLGTKTRAQLVRFASERGIQSFSDSEWTLIVNGAQMMRRE